MKLDIGHIQEYTSFSKGLCKYEQLNKVIEEFEEVMAEVTIEPDNFDRIRTKDELLDLMTAAYNLLHVIGVSQEDIDKHKEKLEGYRRSGKHGKVEG